MRLHQNKQIETIQKWLQTEMGKKYGYVVFATFIAFTMTWIWSSWIADKPKQAVYGDQEMDTHIPPGYVLLPIEISNGESAHEILGRHGVVNLYIKHNNGKRELYARKVKILRAQNHENTFAALVKEPQAQLLLQHSGAFFMAVQNPRNSKAEFLKSKKSKKTSRVSVDVI